MYQPSAESHKICGVRRRVDGFDASLWRSIRHRSKPIVAPREHIDPGIWPPIPSPEDSYDTETRTDLLALGEKIALTTPRAARATSLRTFPGREIVRNAFAVEFVCHFRHCLLCAQEKQAPSGIWNSTSRFMTGDNCK